MKSREISSGIISGDRYLSPQALACNAAKAASALHSAGVWQGDVVALLLRNDFARCGIDKGKLVYLVSPQFNSKGEFLVSRPYLNAVASDPHF